MHARQDIQPLLDDPGTDPVLVAQLESARQLLVFAENTLDLPANGSYSSYVELDGNTLVWNVVATQEFSLEPKKWCFAFTGCLPYRGFFSQAKAEKSLTKLHNKGMDVYLASAPAYSTLGKFKDPLLSTMFDGSDIGVAAFLFHELAHQRLYIKGDGQFNESYASFVEERGVRLWLESAGQPTGLTKWQALQNAGRDFSALITDVRGQLDELYGSGRNDAEKRQMKAETLMQIQQSYDQLRKDKWEGNNYFSGWFAEPLNNAKLALYDTYQGGQCAFQALFAHAGEDMREFHRLAQLQAKLQNDQRSEWLDQSCPDAP
jgi:predicted aminopeptidase